MVSVVRLVYLRFAAPLVALAIQGCIAYPSAATYWEPSAEGAWRMPVGCDSFPDTWLQYPFGVIDNVAMSNVKLRVKSLDEGLTIFLVTPAGGSARFTDRRVVVREAGGAESVAMLSQARYLDRKTRQEREKDPMSVLEGPQGVRFGDYKIFVSYPARSGPLPEELRVTLPAIVVDGVEYRLSTITFRRRSSIGLRCHSIL
jgi:hypothetical protein